MLVWPWELHDAGYGKTPLPETLTFFVCAQKIWLNVNFNSIDIWSTDKPSAWFRHRGVKSCLSVCSNSLISRQGQKRENDPEFNSFTDRERGKTDSTHLPAAKEHLLHDGHRRRCLHVGILTRREGRGEDASRMTTHAPCPALSSLFSLACLPEAPWRRAF